MTSKFMERVALIEALPEEEQARLRRLGRRCDAFSLIQDVFEEAVDRGSVPNVADRENCRSELRVLKEEANGAYKRFQREHGIPEPFEEGAEG